MKTQITHWLNPTGTYTHKTEGEKTNFRFCQEVVKQINKDPKRKAEIIHKDGMIAVFSERKD